MGRGGGSAVKFLCVECDRQMLFEERQLPGDGTLAAAFRCPQCGRAVGLLTNPMETQLVASLGVKIGGTTIEPQPLETVRGMVTTGRDDAFEDGKGETGKGKGPPPAWSVEAQERLTRVPNFVRGMVRKIYADYARERGIGEITPAVMDSARSELGLEGM
jgi:Proto-chlorophyllide reductase 57 kD subunit